MKWFFQSKNYKKINKIAIIGGGPSGLQALNLFKKEGYNVKLFEKNPKLGIFNNLYSKMSLPSYLEDIKLPHIPYIKTENDQKITSYDDITKYINKYADNYNLHKNIHLNTNLKSIGYSEDFKKYKLSLENSENKEIVNEEFDFVIIATGKDAYEAKTDYTYNLYNFKGKILHTREIKSSKEFKDKKVVLLGWDNNALDYANAIYNQTEVNSLTIISDRISYGLPSYFLFNKLKFETLLSIRVINFHLLNNPQRENKWDISKYWHDDRNIIKNKINNNIQSILQKQWKIDSDKSDIKFDDDLNKSIIKQSTYRISEDTLALINDKKIKLVKGVVEGSDSDGLVVNLTSSTDIKHYINADVIVVASGYQYNPLKYFDQIVIDYMMDQKFMLFRNVIDPNIPNIAFIGNYNGLFENSVAGLQALWLTKFINGQIVYDYETMKEIIEEEDITLDSFNERYNISDDRLDILKKANVFEYMDILLNDMNVDLNKVRGFIKNNFTPFRVEDMNFLFPKPI